MKVAIEFKKHLQGRNRRLLILACRNPSELPDNPRQTQRFRHLNPEVINKDSLNIILNWFFLIQISNQSVGTFFTHSSCYQNGTIILSGFNFSFHFIHLYHFYSDPECAQSRECYV